MNDLHASTQQAVRALLRETTSLSNCDTLPARASLKDAGMTSFELVAMLMQAEEFFDVALPDDGIDETDVASIAAIATTIERARAAQVPC